MANCLPQSLAASKGRALICEGTAFRATREKGGCCFRSCQGNRLGIGLMRSNRVRARTIPKGLWHVERMVSRVLVCQSQRIASIRPKLARRLLPWVGVRKGPQRQRRCGRRQVRGRERTGHNRVAVGEVSWPMTQGSSCLATLGFETESRWDSRMGLNTEMRRANNKVVDDALSESRQ